jgi:hypothetical protein
MDYRVLAHTEFGGALAPMSMARRPSMINAAPLPNTTQLNASPRSTTSFAGRPSESSAPTPFSSVLSSAQGNQPDPRSPAPIKSQDLSKDAIVRPKNSLPTRGNPPSTPSQSSGTETTVQTAAPGTIVPTPVSTAADTSMPTPPVDTSSTLVVLLSETQSSSPLLASELETLAAAQTSPTQVPAPTNSFATPPSAPAATTSSAPAAASSSVPAPKDTTDSAGVAEIGIAAVISSSTESVAILLPDSSANDGGTGNSILPSTSTATPTLGLEQLAEVAVQLDTPATSQQTVKQPAKGTPPAVAPRAVAPPGVAPPAVEVNQLVSPELLASIGGGDSSNSSGNAGLTSKKAQSDATAQIAQEFVSKLQAALNYPETKGAPAAPISAATGGKLTGDDANQTTENSDSQGSTSSVSNLALSSAVNQSTNSGDLNQKSQDADSAAAVKAAGLTTVSVDPSLHALADAPGQSAWADAGSSAPQVSKENIPVTSPQAPNPSPQAAPLPASLSDIAQASQLYQRVGGAEMHIAMQTDLLGSIDLHAVVHQSTLSATIGVQRADVQSLLANDLPALQHALADQRFHVEQISVLDTSVGGHLEQGGHQQQQQNGSAPSHLPVPAAGLLSDSREEESMPAWSGIAALVDHSGQLSIRV